MPALMFILLIHFGFRLFFINYKIYRFRTHFKINLIVFSSKFTI